MTSASIPRQVPNESFRGEGPGLRSHLVLFTGLSLLTAAQFLLPGQPIAFRNPALAVAISSTAALAGFLTLILGLWHFRVTGAALSLFVALAFGMLGLLGGFTTFSSFSLQTLNLVQDSEWLQAGGNVVGHIEPHTLSFLVARRRDRGRIGPPG